MEKGKIDRINQLAHLAKERALTEEELAERDVLRREYIADFRKAAIDTLDSTYVLSPDRKTKIPVRQYNLAQRKQKKS